MFLGNSLRGVVMVLFIAKLAPREIKLDISRYRFFGFFQLFFVNFVFAR
jgi:hypothetical protein